MDNKKIIAIIIVGLFVFGGLGMMFLSNKGPTQMNVNQQQKETRDEMMARMHPPAQNSDQNLNMDTIKFSEAIGKPAPDFTLTNHDGSEITLSDYKDKTVILFFSGGAMCYPACWNQIESLGTDERFNNENVMTISVVVDAKEKWDKIISSQPKFGVGKILFDTNKAVSQAYDMLYAPSSMHKGLFPGHTYMIIKNGVISDMIDDPNMGLNNDLVASKL